jgi:predicted CXXCH cytochrome family protein
MRLRTYLILAGVAVLLVSFGSVFSNAAAGSSPKVEAAVESSPPAQIDNSSCLYCHGRDGFSVQLKSGETLSLTINPDQYDHGVHGSNGLDCVTCHTDIKTFPHPERTTDTLREVKLKYYTICRQCHEEQFNLTLDSVHQRALAAGNNNAAVCSDCHNPHTQQRLTNADTGKLLDYARLHIPETCAQCHSAIYDKYKESVHGKALTQEGNLDVPTCIDCHGVHNIQSPETVNFRNSTPFLCAKCHTNNALMHKYGISTDVLNTYVADFHGTTVVLFDKTYPDQPTNKPVCTDCHGVHDIANVNDPANGLAIRKNLLVRCQKCHPDATANFPDAWMSHYIPSPDKYPVVYYVNLFYKFFIPGVLGPMALLVLMDFGRATINRFKKPKPAKTEAPVEETEPTVAPEETVQSEQVEETVTTEPEESTELEQAKETPSTEPQEKIEPEQVEVVPPAEPQEKTEPKQTDETPSTEQAKEVDQPEEESEPSDESKSSDEEENFNDR